MTVQSTTGNQLRETFARWRGLIVCLLLAGATLAVFWPVTGHEFVGFDDHIYVTENPQVQAGLTWEGVQWAFGTGLAGNWHPLTWLSHMLDVTLFGNNAGAHHLVSLLFHCANTVLLFLVLWRMTNSQSKVQSLKSKVTPPDAGLQTPDSRLQTRDANLWRSAFVAAVFALHPLRVESVAWVSERKDVLSTMFFLLTLWAYAKYVSGARREASGEELDATRNTQYASCFYGLALLCFALGLMSKAMLVTVPFVLLLLDWWPLRRFTIYDLRFTIPRAGSAEGPLYHKSRQFLEKLPFFAISAVFCVVTYVTQQKSGALTPADALPFGVRVQNALVSYLGYAQKTFWPTDLALLYPYSKSLPLGKIVLAVLFLLAVTAATVQAARRHPHWLFGWLWFVGTLVPVIGLIQVGRQAMADRYTYIPSIGLFIALAWGAGAVTGRWPAVRPVWGAIGLLTLAICGALSRAQVRVWANSETLFRHTLAVTRDNYVFHGNLGFYFYRAGRLDEAIEQFRIVLRLRPAHHETLNGLGCALVARGEPDEAVELFKRAVQIKSDYAEAYNNLGNALLGQEKFAEAKPHLLDALRIKPDYADAHYNLGIVLAREDDLTRAAAHYEEALRIKPDFPMAHNNLGNVRLRQGRVPEAIEHFRSATRLDPRYAQAHNNLANVLARLGKFAEAETHFQLALENGADAAEAHTNLGKALSAQGKASAALSHYRQALALRPDESEALNNLAWILATHPESEMRDGNEAVTLAKRAAELPDHADAGTLDTLAAAYAETGRFAEAIQTARDALNLATAAGSRALADQIETRLKSFQAGQPWREPPH